MSPVQGPAPSALPDLPVLPGDPCLANACSACCHDTEMLLTEADVARLSALRPGPFWFRADDGYMQLRTRDAPGAPCWFLEGGRCSVWADRPEGCRAYPAVWDGRRTLLDARHCPHTGDFALRGSLRGLAGRLESERVARSAAARAAAVKCDGVRDVL